MIGCYPAIVGFALRVAIGPYAPTTPANAVNRRMCEILDMATAVPQNAPQVALIRGRHGAR